MLNIDMLGFLFEDRRGAFLEESHVSSDDILSYDEVTYLWNIISCLMSLRSWNPARDFLELKTSFSTKDSYTFEKSGASMRRFTFWLVSATYLNLMAKLMRCAINPFRDL
jgi:hypothetical protein